MFGSSPIEIMAMNAMINGLIYAYGFTYSALWFAGTALGASATVNVNTQITADSDFIIQRMNLVSYTALDTPEVNPDFTLLLTLAGSGTNLMDQAQHVNNVCGNFFDNRVPNDLPFPILIQANNNIQAQLVNRSAVAQNFTQLSYVGFKVKYLANPDGSPTTRQQVFHAL
ncbi:hypothetical protein L0244_38715 [bacterium]|nr:hypothetical protein [bacterium]